MPSLSRAETVIDAGGDGASRGAAGELVSVAVIAVFVFIENTVAADRFGRARGRIAGGGCALCRGRDWRGIVRAATDDGCRGGARGGAAAVIGLAGGPGGGRVGRCVGDVGCRIPRLRWSRTCRPRREPTTTCRDAEPHRDKRRESRAVPPWTETSKGPLGSYGRARHLGGRTDHSIGSGGGQLDSGRLYSSWSSKYAGPSKRQCSAAPSVYWSVALASPPANPAPIKNASRNASELS